MITNKSTYRLPDPLPAGTILTDSTRKNWEIGESIGSGGFSQVYCARCLESDSRKRHDYPFVVKVDHLNGPLYAEMHFYHRVAKVEQIDQWMLKKGLSFLGMPRYVASGIHIRENKPKRGDKTNSVKCQTKYRFLVLDRLGFDLQKILDNALHNNQLDIKNAYTIAIMVLDILSYIHSFGYIHADIKASNLLFGRSELTPPARELYLVDYGLVERYMSRDGQHKEQEEDQRRANNGTIEFTSRDGHLGALSRRSDLEILVYNLISWLSGGRLPWMECKDFEEVRQRKVYYMAHIEKLMRYAFGANPPRGLIQFVKHISKIGFKQKPDYEMLKNLLVSAIDESGFVNDGFISWKISKKGCKRSRVPSKFDSVPRKFPKLDIQEFNEIDSTIETPRKRGRPRGLDRPKPLIRQKSISEITDLTMLDNNPTPAMIEVFKSIKERNVQRNGTPATIEVFKSIKKRNGVRNGTAATIEVLKSMKKRNGQRNGASAMIKVFKSIRKRNGQRNGTAATIEVFKSIRKRNGQLNHENILRNLI